MVEAITVSKEDYLKAILEAESEGHTVIPATLAHWLSVSAPAVTNALKRLKRDGFVEIQSESPKAGGQKASAAKGTKPRSSGPKAGGPKAGGIIRLTPLGKETAYRTALRHHLVERMLSEVFGMEWYEVHAEAERLEHAVSPAFEARLIEKLGEDGACPHGNTVLPESPARRRKRGLIPLSEALEGLEYYVVSLYERDPKLLIFLYRSGISPDARLRLIARNYDQTVGVETPNGAITLGAPAAERVWVRRVVGRS